MRKTGNGARLNLFHYTLYLLSVFYVGAGFIPARKGGIADHQRPESAMLVGDAHPAIKNFSNLRVYLPNLKSEIQNPKSKASVE